MCNKERNVAARDSKDDAAYHKNADQRYVAKRSDGIHKLRYFFSQAIGSLAGRVLFYGMRFLIEAGDYPESGDENFVFSMQKKRVEIMPRHYASDGKVVRQI